VLGPRIWRARRIANAAYRIAGSDTLEFLRFIALLSINLAVLNFLPIAPLDGGQMVLLIGEKVRGQPLPNVVLSFALMIGIIFVVSLMVFVLFNDVLSLLPQ
jgi:regulator of sigma E protease